MGKWLSVPAVLWAMDEAPDVPPELVSTLFAVARYADENGLGAYPSASTVAAITRKTERQTKRDLARLERRGLLLPGDKLLVKDIRADRRPKVRDLPMPRGDTHDTPSTLHGVTHRVGRGDTQGQNGVSPMSPEKLLKSSGKARASRARAGSARASAAKPTTCASCGQPLIREPFDNEYGKTEYFFACKGCRIHPDDCDCGEVDPSRCAYCRSNDHDHCPRQSVPTLAEAKNLCACWCEFSACEMCVIGEHGCCRSRSYCQCEICFTTISIACNQEDGLDCPDCKGFMPDGETWCMDYCHTAYRESIFYRIGGHPPTGIPVPS